MIVLGIDSSTVNMSVALLRDGVCIIEASDTVERNRTGLLSLVDRLFSDAALTPAV